MKQFRSLFLILALVLSALPAFAQNAPTANATPVQATQALYYVTPISATAAAGAQATLTIPAPPAGLYNYVCYIGFNTSNNATGSAQVNAVTTSTNFNAFAIKFSMLATTQNYDYDVVYGTPATGCAKSTSPGTATTFVSPALQTNSAYAWYATYFQAP